MWTLGHDRKWFVLAGVSRGLYFMSPDGPSEQEFGLKDRTAGTPEHGTDMCIRDQEIGMIFLGAVLLVIGLLVQIRS